LFEKRNAQSSLARTGHADDDAVRAQVFRGIVDPSIRPDSSCGEVIFLAEIEGGLIVSVGEVRRQGIVGHGAFSCAEMVRDVRIMKDAPAVDQSPLIHGYSMHCMGYRLTPIETEPSTLSQEVLYAVHPSESAVSSRRPRGRHRQDDDGNPSRPPSQGLR